MAKPKGNKKSSIIPGVLFVLVVVFGAKGINDNKSEDPCAPNGCKRVPTQPDVDGTLPPGLDK